MTESNSPDPTRPVAPLTPLTGRPRPRPRSWAATHGAPEPEGVAFHERVVAGRGRSTATRVGATTGSALLVLVGVVAAMGASPSPSSIPAWRRRGPVGRRERRARRQWCARDRPERGQAHHAGRLAHSVRASAAGSPASASAAMTSRSRPSMVRRLRSDRGRLDTSVQSRTRRRSPAAGATTTSQIVAATIRPPGAGGRRRQRCDGHRGRAADVVGEITAIDGNTITITQPGATTTATIHARPWATTMRPAIPVPCPT